MQMRNISIIRKLVKLISNPKKYFPLLIMAVQQQLSFLFYSMTFFKLGQMDINPKSRCYDPELIENTGGFFPKNDQFGRQICDLVPWETTRRDMLILLIRTIIERNIDGDFIELGVYKGATAKLIHYYAPERKLHLFDTFEGVPNRSVKLEKKNTGLSISASIFSDTTLDDVKSYISPKNNNIFFYKGNFPESIPDGFADLRFAFVHLDVDLYDPILEGLKFFYPRMNEGGILVIHDYNGWLGARRAVDYFFADKQEIPIPMPDKGGSTLIVKQKKCCITRR